MVASNRVDIYDTIQNTWTNISLTIIHDAVVGASVGNKILIAGGENFPASTFTDFVEILDMANVGINESANQNTIAVYPNPATDKITIESNGNQTGATLCIYSLNGQILFQSQITEQHTEVDISQFSKGIYFVKYMDDATVKVTKFIRE